jgi:lipid-A-disaccharide synthase-like uncharacterized protein
VRPDWFWPALGFFAQGLFAARFLVQWLKSERMGMSVIPMSFWYFSLFGSVLLLAYAIHKQDPVFIAGQLFGSVVYVRNLLLLRRRAAEAAAG